jgi:hypothetical protein
MLPSCRKPRAILFVVLIDAMYDIHDITGRSVNVSVYGCKCHGWLLNSEGCQRDAGDGCADHNIQHYVIYVIYLTSSPS